MKLAFTLRFHASRDLFPVIIREFFREKSLYEHGNSLAPFLPLNTQQYACLIVMLINPFQWLLPVRFYFQINERTHFLTLSVSSRLDSNIFDEEPV